MPINPPLPDPTRQERVVTSVQQTVRKNERQIEVVIFGLALAVMGFVMGVPLGFDIAIVLVYMAGAFIESALTRSK